MRVASVSQQPSERRRYSIDYSEALDQFDSVESVVVKSIVPEGLNVSATQITPRVRLSIDGGTSGVTYKVTLTVTTSNGNEIFEDEVIVKVREV
jgi:hypothetical protein